MEHWYRAEAISFDDYGEVIHIKYDAFDVIKHTPKGVVIDSYDGPRRICGTTRKMYAVPTKELALIDFLKRKTTHIYYMEARLKRARQHMVMAEWELEKLQADSLAEAKLKTNFVIAP